MSQADEIRSPELSRTMRLEAELAAALDEAAAQIAHAECFDEEQRAEVYTILQAIKTDAAAHRQIVGQWVSDAAGAPCHV